MAEKIEVEAELVVDDSQDDSVESAQASIEAAEAAEAADADPPEADTDAEAEAEVERLRREMAALRETSIRTLADFDNFRKRTERETKEAKRYALTEPLRDFLSVVDNLERALSAEARPEDLKIGVEMILRQMHELLRRFGVTAVHAVGERFDPTVHEAVARQEDPEVEHPIVRREMQRGYRIHERLLRPAMVAVAVPPAAPPAPAVAENENPADDGSIEISEETPQE